MPRRLKNQGKYWIERAIVRGAHFRLLFIAAVIGLVSLLAGSIVLVLSGAFAGPGEAIWWAFLRLTDPGYLGDDEGVVLRSVSTVLTVMGYVLFLGALIAIMTQWLNSKLETLESGITPIALNDHILILGWTNRTPTVAAELLLSQGRVRRFLARHGVKRLRLVVLAERVSASLVQDMRDRLGALWDQRAVIFRSGTPLRTEHLQRVDFMNAAAIVIPGADFGAGGSSAVDSRAIKILLSIANHPSARKEGAELPLVVTEIFDARKISVALGAYPGRIEIVASDAMIARLIAQNVRHSGLSRVYGEILTHGIENELYIRECGSLAGQRVQDLVDVFPDAVLLGVVRRDGRSYQPLLNPPPGFVVESDDRFVLLARSYEDSGPEPGAEPRQLDRGHPRPVNPVMSRERRILILGWNHKVPALLQEFDGYHGESFAVDVLSMVPLEDRIARLERHDVRLERVKLTHLLGDSNVPSDLARTSPSEYDNIVLLGGDWLDSGEEADARTIVGYLLLRELLPVRSGPEVLLELMDPGSVSLFRQRRGEVIISPVILGHILAQVALRRELRAVFDELFGPGGAEIFFQPVLDYAEPGRRTDFRVLRAAATLRGETALGVRIASRTDLPGGLFLNPAPDHSWELQSEDELVVLASYVGEDSSVAGQPGGASSAQ
jgi:ion channel POLLUX/CASTOR